tara:strand:- start:277 stop:492 length:216 start_codon:yes stop_codon:yes gene_type:complete
MYWQLEIFLDGRTHPNHHAYAPAAVWLLQAWGDGRRHRAASNLACSSTLVMFPLMKFGSRESAGVCDLRKI